MTVPSFEKINYAVRPAKHAQRKMICEALGQLVKLAPLRTYQYVGFGSVGFHDFSLFHQRHGITDMVSIEGSATARERMRSNRPYDCIDIKWGWSYDVLPTLSWDRRSIVWLDYEHPLDPQKLGDISLLSGELPSGSVLLVTIPVEPGDDGEGPAERLTAFTARVGAERVPRDLRATELSNWGTAKASRGIIHDEIMRTLSDRNGVLAKSDRIKYQQLFNFHYADGKQMLTVGGLLANAADEASVGTGFRELAFVKGGKAPFAIETPILTVRELRVLDSYLPTGSAGSPPHWIPSKERKRYNKLYRYFPNFGVIEA